MTTLQAFLLGLIQGLTEFLPVSSSGHLALATYFFGLDPSREIFFDLVLHMGSLVAVLIYFWREVRELVFAVGAMGKQLARPAGFPALLRESGACRIVWFLILATGVTGVIGLVFQPVLEAAFSNMRRIGKEFLLTGALLLVAQWRLSASAAREREMTWPAALVIGLFQALSLMPAVSRSGATLTGGLLCGVAREQVFRFIFLLSIPSILLVFLVKGMQEISSVFNTSLWPVYAVGFAASFLMSYLALRILHWFLRRRQLLPFALYCFALGLFMLFRF